MWQGSVFTSELAFEELLIQMIATLAAGKHKNTGSLWAIDSFSARPRLRLSPFLYGLPRTLGLNSHRAENNINRSTSEAKTGKLLGCDSGKCHCCFGARQNQQFVSHENLAIGVAGFWNAVCNFEGKNAGRCRSGSSARSRVARGHRVEKGVGRPRSGRRTASIVFSAKVATMRCWSAGFESCRKISGTSSAWAS